MNVYYQVMHDSFHDVGDGSEEEATRLEHSKILRGWTGKEEKKTLLQIISKGNYQVFLADVIKPNQLHFYSIYIAHTASNVQSLALN